MTISTTTTTITYSGNGVTTVFTFPFVGAEASDIIVTLTSPTGVANVLSPSLYTLTFNAIPSGALWAVGGSVTYPLVGSPIAAGYKLSVTRSVPYVQDVSIGNQSNFYPQSVEQGLDLLEMQIQQGQTQVAYSLKVPSTDPTPPNNFPSAAARANSFAAFDANGQPITTTITSGSVPGSTATARRINTTGTSTVNVLTTDSFGGVAIYQSSTPVTTVQLPTTGGPYPVTDGGGNAGTSNITILPPVGKTIDGQTSYVMNTNYQSITFCYDGTQVLIASGSQGLGNNISVPGTITAGGNITSSGGAISASTNITAGSGISTGTGNVTATTGHIVDRLGDVRSLGTTTQSGYTLQATDNGTFIISNGGITVPGGAVFTAGMNVVIYNNSGSPISIVQGSGATLLWGGVGSTGTRTLANIGVATILCLNNANVFVITGAGLS